MKALIGYLAYQAIKIFFFLLINFLFIGSGMLVGLVLNKFVPSVGMEMGTLIGMVSLVVSFQTYRGIRRFINIQLDSELAYDRDKAIAYMDKHFRFKRKSKEKR